MSQPARSVNSASELIEVSTIGVGEADIVGAGVYVCIDGPVPGVGQIDEHRIAVNLIEFGHGRHDWPADTRAQVWCRWHVQTSICGVGSHHHGPGCNAAARSSCATTTRERERKRAA